MKWQDEKRVRMLPENVGEDAVEIRRRARIDRPELDAETPRDRLHLPIAERLARLTVAATLALAPFAAPLAAGAQPAQRVAGARLDALLGEYSEQAGGPAILRITKDRGQYLVSMHDRGNWGAPTQFVECPDSTHAQVFGPDWKLLAPIGLCGSIGHLRFGLHSVKQGASVGQHTFKTGFIYVGLGVFDLYKL